MRNCLMIFGPVQAAATALLALASCRGYDQVPGQEAAWRAVVPELRGMSSARLWQCAGPPWSESGSPAGISMIVYRYADLKNYCEVTLSLDRGQVNTFSASYSAPEFLWLRRGYNYCGQIFKGCLHPLPARNPPQPAVAPARSAAAAP